MRKCGQGVTRMRVLDEHGVAVLEHAGWAGFGDRVRAYGNGIDRGASSCI